MFYCEISQNCKAATSGFIYLKFGRCLSSTTAEEPTKFQNDMTISTLGLVASRLCEIWQRYVLLDMGQVTKLWLSYYLVLLSKQAPEKRVWTLFAGYLPLKIQTKQGGQNSSSRIDIF